jgi:hypothetical protein
VRKLTSGIKKIAPVVGILLCLLFVLPLVSLAEGPTAGEYGVVLNLSGKQRMLTQKMSKEILLVALGNETKKNLKNLDATAKLFDKTLQGLRDGDPSLKLPPTVSKRIIKQLDKINSKYWQEYYSLIKAIVAAGKVSQEQVEQAAALNIPLLKQMNKCVKLYENDASKSGLKSDPSLAVTINLAGKQRMLTQKMSKEFLLIAYGFSVDENKLNLLETSTLFDRTLKGLQAGDSLLDLPGTKNTDILAQLSVVDGLWKKFKPVVEIATDPQKTTINPEEIQVIADLNLPLLKEMNTAVGMFAAEAAK